MMLVENAVCCCALLVEVEIHGSLKKILPVAWIVTYLLSHLNGLVQKFVKHVAPSLRHMSALRMPCSFLTNT